MKKVFIGIDFSKNKFDATLFQRDNLSDKHHATFANNQVGYSDFIQWIKEQTQLPKKDWLFCGEHTGLYSLLLCNYLAHKKYFFWLEDPQQIKNSTGIKRGKTDKTDSCEIAMYAYRFSDKAKCYTLPDKEYDSLKQLFSFRERLIKNRNALLVAARENRTIRDKNATARFIYERTLQETTRLKQDITEVEEKMQAIIASAETIKENYQLITSIKGIAMVNAIAIILATNNFTKFSNSRQYACYCGVVPFEKTSGSSIRGGSHISHIANKRLKTLLTQSAKCAVRFDPELRNYRARLKEKGKLEKVIINNVRNKLIQRVFAVIKRRSPYTNNYENKISAIEKMKMADTVGIYT